MGSVKEFKPPARAVCMFCGAITPHPDYSCPRIAAVDFDEGSMTRVEFHDWTEAATGGATGSKDDEAS